MTPDAEGSLYKKRHPSLELEETGFCYPWFFQSKPLSFTSLVSEIFLRLTSL